MNLSPSRERNALAACLCLSGFSALVFEVVWVRQLRLLFGSTTLAVGSTVAAFMLGLALGGLLGARLSRSGGATLRAYGWLELSIGVWGAFVPFLLAFLPRFVTGSLAFWPATAWRFALVLAALLPATGAMGATLPVAVAALSRRRLSGEATALLYGTNTLGATAGAFATAFLLFPALGVRKTNLAAALLEVILAVFVLTALAPRGESEPADAIAPRTEQPVAADRLAVALYGVVGFCSLALEVCWERALSMVVGASVYSFSCILAAFLVGIGAGSLLVRPWLPSMRRPSRVFAAGIALFALLAIGTTAMFQFLPGAFVRLIVSLGLSSTGFTFTALAVSALAMLPPTLVLGALFPLAARIAAGNAAKLAPGGAGEAVGRIYFANTLGGAIGAFAGGFFLVPWMGLRGAIELACVAALLCAAALLWREAAGGGRGERLAFVASIAAVALAVLLPAPWSPEKLVQGVFRFPVERLKLPVEMVPMRGGYDGESLLFYRDGVNATVSVHRHWGETFLKVNGKTDAGTGDDMATQVLAGEVAMLYGPPAKNVLLIGLASGVTAGSIALHRPERLDVVELEPSIVAASHLFDGVNNRPLEKPFVRLVVDDGRTLLAREGPLYDAIVSEPSNPWMSSAANLFTEEFFRLAKARLAPGGRLVQWVQLYGIRESSLASIFASLRRVFPQVYGFAASWGGSDLMLVASERPLRQGDFPRWETLSPPVQADLQRIGTFSTADLRTLLRMTPVDADMIARLAPRTNTDDDMEVELRSFFEMYDSGNVLARNWAAVGATSKAVLSGATAPSPSEIGDLALSFLETRNDFVAAEALLRLAPPGPASSLASAELAARRGDSSDAVARMLDDIVARFPDSFDARWIRGRWRVDHQIPGAIEDLEKALESRPGDPRARYDLLRALNAAGRVESAYSASRSVRLSPTTQANPQILFETGKAALAAGRFDEASRDLHGFLLWNPYAPDQWKLLATAERGLGHADAARDADANAESARQNVVRRLQQFGLRAEILGAGNVARGYFRKALDLDPSYEPAKSELAKLDKP